MYVFIFCIISAFYLQSHNAACNVPPKIIINEIAWAGTAASFADEWVELYNPGSAPVDLSDYTLCEAGGSVAIIALSGTIEAGGYYLIERTDDHTVKGIAGDKVGPFGGYGLSDSGEYLVLKNGTAVVDEVDCSGGWFAGNASTRATMERIRPTGSGGEATNWADNNGLTINGLDANDNHLRGTPRAVNSVYSYAIQITGLFPANGATAAPTNAPLSMSFNAAVFSNTGNVVISNLAGGASFAGITVTSNAISGWGTTTISIAHPVFPMGTSYCVLISSDAFTNTAGFSFSGYTATNNWSFTTTNTSDILAPTAVLFPANRSVNVNRGTHLRMVMSEAVIAGSGQIILSNLTDTSLLGTITLSSNALTGLGTGFLTITPANLPAGKEIAVIIPDTCLTDNTANKYTGAATTNGWCFTTGTTGSLYREDFSGLAVGTTAVSGHWSTAGVPTGHFCVTNERLEARDTDNEVTWSSPVISLDAVPAVKISAAIAEAGSLSGSDYLKLAYRLDGGEETSFFSQADDLVTGATPVTKSSGIITGSTLQIIFRCLTTTAGKTWRVDDITVDSTTLNPSPDSAVCFDSSGGGSGIQALDRVVLTFNLPITPVDITSVNIAAALPITNNETSRWVISSAAWSNSATLVLTLGAGAILSIGDLVAPSAGYFKHVSSGLGAVGSASLSGSFGPSQSVVINEIAWKGAGDSYQEFIELYNNMPFTVSLTDWNLRAADGSPDITLSGTIPAGGFFLIERTDDNVVNDITADLSCSFGTGLGNFKEDLLLFDDAGSLADRANFSAGWITCENHQSQERKNPMADGSRVHNWAANNGITRNGAAEDGKNWNGTPRATNSCYTPPPDSLITTRFDPLSTNVWRGATNVTVYAFSARDQLHHNFRISFFGDLSTGSLTNGELIHARLVHDTNLNFRADPYEPIIETLAVSSAATGSSWSGSTNLYSCTNYAIMLDLGSNLVFGRTFQPILTLTCTGLASASAGQSSAVLRAVSRPPAPFSCSMISECNNDNIISNLNNETFTISITMNNMHTNDGIGNIIGFFSNHQNAYTRYILTNSGPSNWALSGATIPGNVSPVNYQFLFACYDSQNYSNSLIGTNIQVTGNWPPQFGQVTITPANLVAVPSFTATLNSVVTDFDNPAGPANTVIDLSAFGLHSAFSMQANEGTNWSLQWTFPTNITTGSRQIALTACDNSGGYATTNLTLLLAPHQLPLVTVPTNTTWTNNQTASVTASAQCYDGSTLSAWSWTVLGNESGAPLSLEGVSTATITFPVPEKSCSIVLGVTVKDSYGTESIQVSSAFTIQWKAPVIPVWETLEQVFPHQSILQAGNAVLEMERIPVGTVVAVYEPGGKRVGEFKAMTGSIFLPLPASAEPGVYIIHLINEKETRSFKIILVP